MIHIGLENNAEGRSQAWALKHPGCFAYGADGSSALKAVPQAIQSYRLWIAAHTPESWFTGEDETYTLLETWECYSVDENYEVVQDGYEVNAWFRHDWKPLSSEDVRRGLLLLEWGREDLLQVTEGLSTEVLNRTYPGERWSIAGILNHIGGAEWWYLDRLGLAFPRSDVPEEPFKRLEVVRSKLVEVLPQLIDARKVIGAYSELWSPRKLLRRAVWHEYDHIAHIRKLL